MRPWSSPNAPRRDRANPNRPCDLGELPRGRSHSRSSQARRLRFALYDDAFVVKLEFLERKFVHKYATNESRLLSALLASTNPDHFVSYDAVDALGFGEGSNAPSDLRRQTKCRLNKLLKERLGDAPSFRSGGSGDTTDWILSRRGDGFFLNPLVDYVEVATRSEWHVRPGYRRDIGTWAADRLELDEPPADESFYGVRIAAGNPFIPIPSSAWRRDRGHAIQASPLRGRVYSARHRGFA